MTDVVEAAKAPGVFKLENFLSGIAYPEESITLFTDSRSMNTLVLVREKLDEIEKRNAIKKGKPRTVAGNDSLEEVNELTKQVEELDAKVAASGITFQLRGMAPKVVEEISAKHFIDKDKDYSGTEEEIARDDELICRSIVSITDAQGNVNEDVVTAETIKALRGAVTRGEYSNFVAAIARVNLNGALFDQATDASFLSGRTHVAG